MTIEIRQYPNGKLKYLGEIQNNKFHGPGVYYFENGDCYEGMFKNNKKNGYGIYYFNKPLNFQSKNYYRGCFYNGYKYGQGIYNINNISFKIYYIYDIEYNTIKGLIVSLFLYFSFKQLGILIFSFIVTYKILYDIILLGKYKIQKIN